MNHPCLAAMLALICANSLFAAEPPGDAAKSNDTSFKTRADYVIEPPDVISIEMAKPMPQVAESQPVTGQYLVGPDGTINLRQYGVVHIAGKTASKARIVIQDHLKQYLDSPELSIDVAAYNSKAYCIVTMGAAGDSVRRVQMTGNETVLDAIAKFDSLSHTNNVWISRSDPHKSGGQQILPIDLDAFSQRTETAANYQLLPGDRLYIQTYQTAGRNYNRSRNGL